MSPSHSGEDDTAVSSYDRGSEDLLTASISNSGFDNDRLSAVDMLIGQKPEERFGFGWNLFHAFQADASLIFEPLHSVVDVEEIRLHPVPRLREGQLIAWVAACCTEQHASDLL